MKPSLQSTPAVSAFQFDSSWPGPSLTTAKTGNAFRSGSSSLLCGKKQGPTMSSRNTDLVETAFITRKRLCSEALTTTSVHATPQTCPSETRSPPSTFNSTRKYSNYSLVSSVTQNVPTNHAFSLGAPMLETNPSQKDVLRAH